MAHYRYVEAEICKVPEGKVNAGKEFIRAKIKNKRSMYEPAQTFMCFLPEIIEELKQYIPVDKGGTAEQAQPIPETYDIEGCWCDYIPPTPFYKRHLSNHQPSAPTVQRPKGTPNIKAGDLVRDSDGWGNPIVYKALRVFCQYYIDEDGTKVWIKGCSPEEAGQQAFSAYCVGITENSQPQQVDQPEVITYQAAAPQPNPQPTQQPAPGFIPQPQAGQGYQPQPGF